MDLEQRAEWTPEDRLAWSIDWLRSRDPDSSVSRTLTSAQRNVFLALGALVVAGLVLTTRATIVVLVGSVMFLYSATILLRLWLVLRGFGHRDSISISEVEAFRPSAGDLPRYSVLVPAYREPTVIPHLVAALERLEYPRDRLEVLLVLEADDTDTIAVARSLTSDVVRVVLVPPGDPRTKPKALNYALLEATGELVTIYDAEDLPEPLQLRRAAIALDRHPELGCVQAQLAYFNPKQNLITRWFTLEYVMWFTQFLPGLVRMGAPLPLGGTSNHFRKDVLIEVGGWDPFNVTEDADLGVRLHRSGRGVGVLESVTLEEANSDFINWVKQRSRWYKGYLQTWLLNLRHPIRTGRSLGWRGYAVFNLFVGGTPMLAIVNPIFWALTLAWFLVQPAFVLDIFPAPLLYAGLMCWIVGNFFLLYTGLVTSVTRKDGVLVWAALTMPLYYVMMSLAAYKALYQLVANSSYWEKTVHGLAAQPSEAA